MFFGGSCWVAALHIKGSAGLGAPTTINSSHLRVLAALSGEEPDPELGLGGRIAVPAMTWMASLRRTRSEPDLQRGHGGMRQQF